MTTGETRKAEPLCIKQCEGCGYIQDMSDELQLLHDSHQRLAQLVKTIWAQQCAIAVKVDTILEKLVGVRMEGLTSEEG